MTAAVDVSEELTEEVNVVVPHPNVVGVEVDDNTKFGNVTMTASPAAIS